MKLLLDTHIFLWSVLDNRKLTKKAKSIITQAEKVYVSSASIWEIAIKQGLKKIDGDLSQLIQAITDSGFYELPVRTAHAAMILQLPNLHRDPFDRLLIAQAKAEPLFFLTADKQLQEYSSLVSLI
ncbi:MAG: type II toxin-antitoxin system VapC family toxin [Chlamydiota bacterium]